VKLGSLVVLVLLALLAPGPAANATIPVPADVDPRPDVVFVLMDDFSLELLATMPEAQRLKADGASYDNAFVVDSLCCPSRASIFTGQAPHQTGVLTNTPNDYGQPIGGFEAFVQYGNLEKSFNVALQASGYTTGFIGKYMNRYEATTVNGVTQPPPPVPGWTDWEAILGGGYNGWGYKSTRLDEAGHVVLDDHPKPAITDPAIDEQYATNVAADKAVDFIRRHRDQEEPYFLEVAVYGPHSQLNAAYPGQPQFPSAMADRAPAGQPTGGNCGLKPCGDLTLADLVGYGDPRAATRPRTWTPTARPGRPPPGAPTTSCSPTPRP
jgi:arylsulfatase A-like enzyme